MAAHTSLLLVIALCAAAVHSLQCYYCFVESNNAKCLKAINCSSGETYCETKVGLIINGDEQVKSIIKDCASSCTPSPYFSCCTTDLCNYSAGATIRSSRATILLALGSVLIILKSSVL